MITKHFSYVSGDTEVSQRGAWRLHTPCEPPVSAREEESNISYEGGSSQP